MQIVGEIGAVALVGDVAVQRSFKAKSPQRVAGNVSWLRRADDPTVEAF